MDQDRGELRTRTTVGDTSGDSSGFMIADDQAPSTLWSTSRYQIVGELGRGGEGIVYAAQDAILFRKVAIKVLRPEFAKRPEIVRRFIQEALTICRLQHPGIAQIFDVGTCPDGRPFHAMQYIKGEDMAHWLSRLSPTPEHLVEAIRMFGRVCDTMAYTHSRGIVHLDLKPGNFRIGVFGEVHVMDWGRAQKLGKDSKSHSDVPSSALDSKERHAGGTLPYMSPEQARGEPVSKRADVFSLGACICHILTGKPPYLSDDRKETVRKVLDADLTETRQRLAGSAADPVLVNLALRCMNEDPAGRPVDAGEVSAVISDYETRALRRFESDMSRFFELSHDLFCFADLNGYLCRTNSNFTTILGYSQEELISVPFMTFVHEDDRPGTVAAMQDLIEGKPVIRFRNRYRTKKGTFVQFEWTAKSLPAEGLIFAVARDVTD
jgi:eukaryotic-like serine/threonine-protein kinase